jgi:hypothetical protein
MIRFLTLVMAGLLVAFYVPRTRDVVVGYTMPLLNPAFRLQTLYEMRTIADEVALYERDNPGRIPPANTFPAWLRRSFTPGAAHDSWGGTYRVFLEAETFAVVSWGADRTPQTPDDLRVVRRLSSASR